MRYLKLSTGRDLLIASHYFYRGWFISTRTLGNDIDLYKIIKNPASPNMVDSDLKSLIIRIPKKYGITLSSVPLASVTWFLQWVWGIHYSKYVCFKSLMESPKNIAIVSLQLIAHHNIVIKTKYSLDIPQVFLRFVRATASCVRQLE